MRKELKEMIEKAEDYELGKPLSSIYVISTNKLYRGFWGKNGYNGIIIIGKGYKEDKYYFVNRNYECDVVWFNELDNLAKDTMIEIPHDTNVIHMWWHNPVCFRDLCSMLVVRKYENLSL